MKNKKLINLKFAMFLVFGIFLILFFSFSISAYSYSQTQYTQSGFGYSSGVFGSGTAEPFDSKMCKAGQDFVLQVAPTGCTPAIVRSDLLEEQDTWVYCPISATKINPLIKIEAIDRLILENEEFSKYVSDIGFHPVRSALGVQDKVTNPVLENIGYAVVKLKRIPTEAEMPDFVEGNITARLVYDIENAFGTFRTGFYLKPMKDEEWNKEFLRYGFWRGKGYVRAEDVQSDRAIISVYSGNTISRSAGTYQQKLATFSLKKGEESNQIYLPTFDYCLGGLKVKLDDIKDPETTARLKINADDVEVVRGEIFLDNKCVVNKIEKIGLNQKVEISCEEDLAEGGFLGFGKSKPFELEIKPKIELKIEDDSGIKLGNYSIGEWLFDAGEKAVFLSYAYTKEDSPYAQDLRVAFTALPKEDVGSRKQLTDDELKSFKGFVERYRKDEPDSGVGAFWTESWNKAESLGFLFEIFSRWAISGESFDVLEYHDSNNLPEELGISKEQTKYVTVLGLASPGDSLAMKDNSDYKNAVKDFDILYSDFSSIKEYELKDTPEYGQRAFEEKIKLARDTGQKKTMFELCEQFKNKYPNSNIDEVCFNEFEFASEEISSADVLINNKVKEISLRSIYEPTFDDYGAEIAVKFPNGKREKYPLQKEDVVYLNAKSIGNLPEKLSESEALKIISDEGIKIKDNSVKFEGVRPQTLLEIIDLKEKCDCEITITSVTDGTHASGEFSHGTGYKIDLRSKDKTIGEEKKLYEYIKDNFVKMPDRKESDGTSSKQWKNKGGAIYALEYEGKNDEHWDVLVSGERDDLLSEAKKGANQFIQLKELEITSGRGSAVIRINIPKDFWTESFKFTDSIKLEEDVAEVVSTKDGLYEFTLKEVNLKQVAKISVLPRINYAESESKFNFKIGIDKRDIKLAPEKTKERIEKLNKTIEDFEKVSEVMGKTIKGFKGACLGVGGALHIKNLAENTQGKGIARQKVMRGDGGWYEICADAVNSGTYKTQEQCLIKESENIDKDVQAMTKTLAQQQEDIKTMQNEFKSDAEFLEEKMIDTEKFAGKYAEQIKNNLESGIIGEINTGKPLNDQINLGEMQDILVNPEGFDKNLYDAEELRDIDLSLRTLNNPEASPRMKDSAKANLYSTLLNVQKNSGSFVSQNSWAKDLGIESSQIATFILKDAKEIPYTEMLNNGKISGIDATAPVQAIQTSDGKQYLIVLDDSAGTDVLTIKKDSDGFIVYDKTGKIRVSKAEAEELEDIYFRKYDKSSYENPFKRSADHDGIVVRYYDTEAYKNLPAVVPFDLKNGWYVAARQNLPVLGKIKSYDESGRVNNFYLCNVGADGIEEFFSGIGDDNCQQIFLESGKTYRSFPGLSESDAINLAESAVSAIEQASTARSKNPALKIGDKIRINTRVGGNINVGVGKPAVQVSNIQCEDFMSPKECNIIFNLCDPVICPNSRCDFGGEYPVKDVIQSGMVGSTLLCAPNWKEKIYAPVCLTGIQASLDNVNSVFKGARDCLQTSLDTGEMVGICDEITSVYMCELVWRETAPIAKIGISKVAAKIFGQGTRGGGEYLSVADSWERASKSVEYFTQSYGANSYAAFKARTSAEQLATPVCKGFISGVVPKIETFFNAITEPDSPIQFTARFDEIPYSDLTVPPVSQYKVFYHIYAGKDKPVYYQVYLKPDAEGSFYADASMFRNVASGFIPKGEIATETKDFTAPAGYKKLCINANGQEECGFKEVSTSFAVDYVKDKYAQEQITKTGISSEKECASGTPSLYNFLTPNIQSSAEGAISPEIYKRGITRICATNNPGQETDSSRWLEVGRCSDVDQNMKCWLDQSSVKDAIEFAGTRNETITALEKIFIDGLNLSENYERDFNLEYEKIQKLEQTETGLREKILKATGLLGKTFFNKQKAKVFLERGKAYAELAKLAYKNFKDKEIKSEAEEVEKEEIITEKIDSSDFRFVPLSFRISDSNLNFDLLFGFADDKWYVWTYNKEFQFDYGGTLGEPTLSGQTGEFDFTGGEWATSSEAVNRIEEFGGLNDEEKRFIKSFSKVKNYQEGFKALVDKTLECGKGCALSPGNKVEMFVYNPPYSIMFRFDPFYKEGIFVIYDIYFTGALVEEIYGNAYFSYNSSEQWNVYHDESRLLPKDIQNLVFSLDGRGFYEGADIIFKYESLEIVDEEFESFEIAEIPKNLIDSYNKYENLFDKYSKENLPKGFTEDEFKALLVAISQKETQVGTLNACVDGTKPCSEWIMGFDNLYREVNKGTEIQIQKASSLLKRAFEGQVATYNNNCNLVSGKNNKNEIDCILNTYRGYGEEPEYAEIVLQLKGDWETYFEKTGFSNPELNFIKNAKECGDCGTIGLFGNCNEKMCSAIGEKLNRECEFRIVIPEGEKFNCIESQDFSRSLKNISEITANLVNRYNINNFEWSGTNALIILKNTINLYPKENGRKYSDNKYFVDQLYKKTLLLKEEYDEIRGEGLFNLEEDMVYIYDLLKNNPYIKDFIDPSYLNRINNP